MKQKVMQSVAQTITRRELSVRVALRQRSKGNNVFNELVFRLFNEERALHIEAGEHTINARRCAFSIGRGGELIVKIIVTTETHVNVLVMRNVR